MLIKKICFIGTDNIGGPLSSIIALKCPEIDIHVVDENEERIMQWNSERLPVFEPGLDDIVKKCRNKNLFFTSDMTTPIREADIIFICGKTPMKNLSLSVGKTADFKNIEDIARLIAKIADFHKIIVEKTTVALRASETIKAILKANQRPGLDFQVLSNPEFFLEGNAVQELLNPERVLIGAEKTAQGAAAIESLMSVYEHWIPRAKIITTDNLSAELSKIATSAFLAQKISSINSLSEVCEITNADVSEVATIIGMDSRIGSKFIEPSLGFGGSIFHQDLQNLVHLCESLHLSQVAEYWKKVLDINDYQCKRFMRKIVEAFFYTLTGKKIAIFGFSCKKDTEETIHSPAIYVSKKLIEEGPKLTIFDPVVAKARILEALQIFCSQNEKETLEKSITISDDPYEAAAGAHGIVFCADWDLFKNLDYNKIYNEMAKPAHIFDGRIFLPHKDLMEIGFQVHTLGKTINSSNNFKF